MDGKHILFPLLLPYPRVYVYNPPNPDNCDLYSYTQTCSQSEEVYISYDLQYITCSKQTFQFIQASTFD